MSEQDKTAHVQEQVVNEPANPEAVVTPEAKPATDKKEETIGQALDIPAPEVEKPEETVPLSALIDIKKENKRLMREAKELKKSIEEGATRSDVNASIDALAEKFPETDPAFFKELAAAVRAEVRQEAEASTSAKLKPIEEKERAKKIDERFEAHFAKVIESLPEYEKIVDKQTIKDLSLLPSNANKTFTQLIEKTYGHLVTGKPTIDAGSSRAGRAEETEVDHARAVKDPAYFDQIMANPVLKEKYNKGMVARISQHL